MASAHHNHTFLHVIIVVLIIIAGFVLFRLVARQSKWDSYVVDSQQKMENFKKLDSVKDASILEYTIFNFSESLPLIKQPKELQSYVKAFSAKTLRDIVILDTNRKILADTISSNIGKKYSEDKNGEITKTIGDSIPRNFMETSSDYPNGISETVVPLKDNHGATVGAIIMSDSSIFNK
jgi:hypothetical protein